MKGLQARIRRICQSRTASVDTHRDSANQVAHPHRQSCPEERISGVVVIVRIYCITAHETEFCAEDDSHDDAIDSDDFTEDNRDEVLGSYSRGFDATTKDRGAGYEYAPVGNRRSALFQRTTPAFAACALAEADQWMGSAYHAAPTTDSPMHSAMPKSAQAYGDILRRNSPT